VVNVLTDEVLRHYPTLKRKDLPLYLPTTLGGIGEDASEPSDFLKKIEKNILRIRSPLVAEKATKMLMRVFQVTPELKQKPMLKVEDLLASCPKFITEDHYTSSKARDQLYKAGKIIWLRLAAQFLRGAVESASIYDCPPVPLGFKEELGVEPYAFIKQVDKLYDYLGDEGVADYEYSDPFLPGLHERVPSYGHFINSTLESDIPTDFLSGLLGGHLRPVEVITPESERNSEFQFDYPTSRWSDES